MRGTWSDDTTYVVDGVEFVSAVGARFDSSPERFCVVKRRPLVDRYLALLDRLAPTTIVELGIFQGGSTALLALEARPELLLAFEYRQERVAALDDLVAARSLDDVVRVEYGVDQRDGATLRARTVDALDGRPLDLVIDDASHLVEPTRASFNALFPLLRPGGLFVLEDWSWAHVGFGSHLPDEVPLTAVVFEFILALPSRPGLIGEIHVDRDCAVVERGPGDIDPDAFDVSDCYDERGRDLVSELRRPSDP